MSRKREGVGDKANLPHAQRPTQRVEALPGGVPMLVVVGLWMVGEIGKLDAERLAQPQAGVSPFSSRPNIWVGVGGSGQKVPVFNLFTGSGVSQFNF